MTSRLSISPRRLVAAVAGSCALLASVPSAALAAPPANDDYLQSIAMNTRGSTLTRSVVKDSRDTREATVQSDLFAPQASGGGSERTTCNTSSFGKTVWYDFHPDSFGTAEIQTAGFDAVVVVYEFDPQTSRITRVVGCRDERGTTEDFFAQVRKGRSYTIQIGGADAGAGPAAGDLQLTFQFFGDRDRDGVFDPLDQCVALAGVPERGGCPPELESTPKLSAAPTSGGIEVRRLSVATGTRAKVSLRCRSGCSAKQTRRGERVRLTALDGDALRAGAVFEVRVTKRGHIGAVHRYRVLRGNFKRIDRCTLPGSSKPRKRCP